MVGWWIELLGTPRVLRLPSVEGVEAASSLTIPRFATEKTAATLAALALSPSPLLRETLAERFWPGKNPTLSRRSLRAALGFLREMLGPEVVLADRETAWLARDQVQVDIHQFEAELAGARRLYRQSARLDERILALQRTVALYRGDFLTGCDDPEGPNGWIETERVRWRAIGGNALLELAAALEESGDTRGAYEVVLRAAETDPMSDAAHETAVRLGAISGHRGGTRVQQKWDISEKAEEQARSVAVDTLNQLSDTAKHAVAALTVFPATFTDETAAAIARVSASDMAALIAASLVQIEEEEGESPRRLRLARAIPPLASRLLPAYTMTRLRERHARFCTLQPAPRERLLSPEDLRTTVLWWLRKNLDAESWSPNVPTLLFEVAWGSCRDLRPMVRQWLVKLWEASDIPAASRNDAGRSAGRLAIDDDDWPEAERIFGGMIAASEPGSPSDETGVDDALLFSATLDLATTLYHRERYEESFHLLGKVLIACDRARSDPSECPNWRQSALYRQSEALLALGRIEEALTAIEGCLTLRRAHLNPDPYYARLDIASALYQRGLILARLPDRAAETGVAWDQALALFRDAGATHGVADCLQQIGTLRAREGRPSEGRFLVEQAISLYAQLGKTSSHAAARGVLGDVLLLEGDLETARQLYEAALEFWEKAGHRRWTARFQKRLLHFPQLPEEIRPRV